MIPIPTKLIPTPIPAFVPVDRPEFGASVWATALAVGEAVVVAGAVVEVSNVEILVEVAGEAVEVEFKPKVFYRRAC
ncbi:hypothetical protein UCRPA7_6748 [Phaeoacremonium minimum UCRPA7]|uniref:Uncharacterized protein n=1 Tax=Phaeoacremonium minimum (strain UCR-PA7) TaxID=1286976 RepID=R8BEK8_PHAM7|nr:hypothetical protein UCRPA7_6748 [Phaeoacremonium minimum UCRPA7]EON97732.1 hypothetical protein UCRPA7_6748 [Phaeoacremonium minimum UCRPA7]